MVNQPQLHKVLSKDKRNIRLFLFSAPLLESTQSSDRNFKNKLLYSYSTEYNLCYFLYGRLVAQHQLIKSNINQARVSPTPEN